jgi:predicted outer membrane protein
VREAATRPVLYELARHRRCQNARRRPRPQTHYNFEQESEMHNNKLLKRLLAVTAVAAMFSAFGVHAQQTTGSSSTGSTSSSGQATTQTGKTTSEGTTGNTESRGKDEKTGSQGAMQGSSGSQSTTQGASGSQGTSGMSDTTGTGASAGMTGKTTSEGTVGNTNSTGMEKRQGKDKGMSGSKGTSGTSGSQGTSGGGGTASTGGTAAAGATAAAGKSALDKADEKMLKAMAQANIAEIEAGKLAQSKSQNDQVKSFAQQMIDDHSKALSDVQALAQQKGVTLPTEPDAKHKAMATKLESLSGDAFDKEYMAKAGVSDHKAVHSALMRDEKKAKDPDVKALASKMTPVVEQHLKSAEQMKSAKSGTTSGK